MSTENLIAATGILQSAQEALESAHRDLINHNIDLNAHADIRALIDEKFSGDAIYTRPQIEQIITDGLQEHKDTRFSEAHPGWEDFNTTLTTRLATIENDIQDIKDWIDGKSKETTTLEQRLQAIEDRYAPVLANIQRALEAATTAGNTVLADSYRESIAQTLNQKNADLMAAVDEWQAEQ